MQTDSLIDQELNMSKQEKEPDDLTTDKTGQAPTSDDADAPVDEAYPNVDANNSAQRASGSTLNSESSIC